MIDGMSPGSLSFRYVSMGTPQQIAIAGDSIGQGSGMQSDIAGWSEELWIDRQIENR